jgi:hypothetical protein
VATSYRPGGEPGHTLIDTQWEITMTTDIEALVRRGKVQEFNCHIGTTTMFAQLGVLPDVTSAVAASAPPR